jgi:radical SAM superfamily enzyme YgiQ (UPF0313 family)
VQIKLVSLEDGITSCGFRKMAAYVARLNADTEACYVTTTKYRSVRSTVTGKLGDKAQLAPDRIDEIAQGLAGADLVGYSSMTGYAELTRRIVARLREISPGTYQVWGGIHPIIHPEDAILADVDAICTGEGEFAFEQLHAALSEGRDPTGVKNFWFRNGEVIRNGFLPLMSVEDMESLPFPQYGEGEVIYRAGEGFVPMRTGDYLDNDGLGYTTLWSIGCPFHCSYCGNTKFIANDKAYKKIRHPSARYIVDEVKAARARFPHLSQVSFHDDSFMAIPYKRLEEFAELWKAELGIPFAVYGVIPNYVKQEKFELLTWAGMNRIRMGIQSGSQAILDFYKRPTPPDKILAAGKVNASFAPKYHIPPAYDIIMDNPVETRQDVVDTLELLYAMERPFTLLIYSLKVIPNTGLEEAMKERGIDLDEIDDSYLVVPPRWANLMLYVIALWRPPRRLWEWGLRRVRASSEPQKLYPRLGLVLRTAYLTKRVLSHIRVMDFSITPGRIGWIFWRLGIVRFYQRHFTAKPPRPQRRRDTHRVAVPS